MVLFCCKSNCLTFQINNDLTFFGNTVGFVYSAARGTFEETPDPIPRSAENAACGVAITVGGARIVVVAGGSENPWESLVYDVASETWEQGPALPFGLSGEGNDEWRNGY